MTAEAERLAELFEPFGPITVRRMFGGAGIYHDGLMFALVADGEIYLKTDAESDARFAAAGSRPFVFQARGRTVETSYRLLPEAALDEPELMRSWAEVGYAAALRARKPGRKSRGKT